jgi:hypothetical protein
VYALSVPSLVLLVCVSSAEWWTQVSSAVTMRDEKASHISRTPWNIRAHGWCAKWGFRSLTIEHKTYRKAFIPSCWRVLKLMDVAVNL